MVGDNNDTEDLVLHKSNQMEFGVLPSQVREPLLSYFKYLVAHIDLCLSLYMRATALVKIML